MNGQGEALYHISHMFDSPALKYCLILCLCLLKRPGPEYRVHVDAMSEEEVAQVGRVTWVIRLQCGKRLQDVKSCVLLSLSYQAQTQVHGICKNKNTHTICIRAPNFFKSRLWLNCISFYDFTFIKTKVSAVKHVTLICTWNVTPLMPQALDHLWDVLLVFGLGQREDDLHDVPVHQTAVCTVCCLQSLKESKLIRKREEWCKTE